MPYEGVDYTLYEEKVNSICNSGDLSTFKHDPEYQEILEHVRYIHGLAYFQLIASCTSISEAEIAAFCSVNDSVGSPDLKTFGRWQFSCTRLRYIFHTHLIFEHCNSLHLSEVDIVEIGGGYGGLCLALHHFSKKYKIRIRSYTIIDLPGPSRLQQMYLAKIPLRAPVNFVDASTYGKKIDKRNMFLISNYRFSEISPANQDQYIINLFPKVAHGFLVWNFIELYDIGFQVTSETEYPQTGMGGNKYIRF